MHEDIKELKADVKLLVSQSAVHNEILRTHESRSIALQEEQKVLHAQLEPIKEHVALVSRVLKILGAVCIGALTQAVIRYLI